MAIVINTNNASTLLASIKKAIDNKKIATWSYDDDGDFTHTPDQWAKKAWLRPSTDTAGVLKLTLISPKGVTLTKVVSGVYQGRFVEMLVTHFESSFTTATTSIP
ncbi:MAG: hypothetical protein JST86_09620 [Bacteroidetes bacterium]|nr:hypothetical protein [Bacteroidota bacterium]